MEFLRYTDAQPPIKLTYHHALSFFPPTLHFGQVLKEALVNLFSYSTLHSFCFSRIK